MDWNLSKVSNKIVFKKKCEICSEGGNTDFEQVPGCRVIKILEYYPENGEMKTKKLSRSSFFITKISCVPSTNGLHLV